MASTSGAIYPSLVAKEEYWITDVTSPFIITTDHSSTYFYKYPAIAGYRSHSHQIPDLFAAVSHSDSPTTMVLHSHQGASRPMTEKEFMKWLERVDANRDGRISRRELSVALSVLGLNWTTIKSWSAVRNADLNHNNYIDGEEEITKLKEYATTHWNI